MVLRPFHIGWVQCPSFSQNSSFFFSLPLSVSSLSLSISSLSLLKSHYLFAVVLYSWQCVILNIIGHYLNLACFIAFTIFFKVSSYLWDFANYLLPVLGILILFLCFGLEEFAGDRLGYIFLLFVFFGLAVIPIVYLTSFFYMNTAIAYSRLTLFNVGTGMLLPHWYVLFPLTLLKLFLPWCVLTLFLHSFSPTGLAFLLMVAMIDLINTKAAALLKVRVCA